MIEIEWNNKFNVGHERIDNEHRVFLNLLRAVSAASESEPGKQRVLRLLLEVQKYAEFHFVSEENIMIDIDYPDFGSHHKEHKMLLAQLEEKFHAFRNDETSLERIVEFLFEWFALHTTRRDRDLANYIAK